MIKEESRTIGQTTLLSLSSSLESRSGGKYGDLVEESILKKTRNELLRAFSYIYGSSPDFEKENRIIMVIRLMQLFGPSLLIGYENIWPKADLSSKATSVISVLFHLFPLNIRSTIYKYFVSFYIVLSILQFSIIVIASKIYRNSSKLPIAVSNGIAFYYVTFSEVLHPVALQLVFEKLSYYVFIQSGSISDYAFILVVVFLVILQSYIVISIASQGMVFRPTSLMGVSSNPPNLVFLITPMITSILAFGSLATKSLQIITIVFGIILYLFIHCSSFIYGGFIKPNVSGYLLATSTTSVFSLILFYLDYLIVIMSPFRIMFALCFIWIVSYFAWFYILNKQETSYLQFLDDFLEKSSDISMVKSPNVFLGIVNSGFRVAHPACINWSIFKQALDQWNDDISIWYAFAKFIAIYPEENQTLAWIFNSVVSQKLKGNAARSIKLQSISIAYARETNLTPTLKLKLNTISRQIQSSKHKLRYVWDVVIQGNTNEVENATKRFFEAIEKNEADFSHLMIQFPNNRFVSRAYHRFLHELLADYDRAKTIIEKTKKLSRGIIVSSDKAHEQGLNAFPNLPSALGISKNSEHIQQQASEISYNGQSDIEFDLEEKDQDIKDSIELSDQIENLVFPSIRRTFFVRLLEIILCFLGLYIAILFYFSFFVQDVLSPLPILQSLSSLRLYTYLITSISQRYFYESIGVFPLSSNRSDPLPVNLGSTYNLRDQLTYLLSKIISSIHSVGELRDFKIGDSYINDAKVFIFSPTINYSLYKSPSEIKYQMISIQGAVIDYVIQLRDIIEKDSTQFTEQMINTSIFLNTYVNIKSVADSVSSALSEMNKYLAETDSKYRKIWSYGLLSSIAFGLVVFFYTLYWQIDLIHINKNDIYLCLTSLPKNTVSNASESLRVVKNDLDKSSTTKDSDMSKQEENILKMFNNGGNHSSRSLSDSLFIIIGTILLVVLYISCAFFIYQQGNLECDTFYNSAPHIDYVSGTLSLALGGILNLNNLGAAMFGKHIAIFPISDIITRIRDRFSKSLTYYHFSRYGGESLQEIPFLGFINGLTRANSQSTCIDRRYISSDLQELAKCYRVDILYTLLLPIINHMIDQYEDNNVSLLIDDKLSAIWKAFQFPLYDAFFSPMFEDIIPTISNTANDLQTELNFVIISLLIVGVIVEVIVLLHISRIEKHMKSVLSLLQHCPISIILQTQKIISVLSGSIGLGTAESMKRDAHFFEKVFNGMPDSIIVVDSFGFIESTNNASQRMFCCGDLIGKRINEIIIKDQFDNPEILKFMEHESQLTIETNYNKQDGTKVHITITSVVVNDKNVISIRDITQILRYNSLILEERLKSDKILSSILPLSLVKRVQNGEKNISFSVQSASIIFIDIVEFTPWCGSLPASTVMLTLNDLFRRFDGLIGTYSQLTKIKCIGDCYMAAGGIFSEINNPADHAKQSVSFGLDALKAINELNKELNQNLRIRVGINTGGPIVAGVLGISKPTFEIFGPVINMAQQMEHHGIPNNIHISRSVYELIYGDVFIVKERGSVEIKGGSVLTYLVTGKQ